MARGFGSGHSIEIPFNSHATQRTYSVWVYREGAGGAGGGRVFEKRVSGDRREALYWNGGGGDYAYFRDWTTLGQWSTNGADPFGTTTWGHLCVTYDAGSTSNNPVIWGNGSVLTITEDDTPSGSLLTNTDNYVIGNRKSDSARDWDGWICEFAIWDRILTNDEIGGLASALSADHFPNALVSYSQLVRQASDLFNGEGTVTGTAVQDHPRIVYPKRRKVFTPSVVASVATTGRLVNGGLVNAGLVNRGLV